MVEEIEKKVSKNLEHLTKKTQELGIRLASFVISCWIVIGCIGIGLIAPMYLVKNLIQNPGIKEAHAATVPSEKYSSAGIRSQQMESRWNKNRFDGPSAARFQRQPDFRSDLRQARNAVSELKGLSRGLRSFAVR